MKTIITEHDNHQSSLCAYCNVPARWAVSNAIGARLLACDAHVGDAAGNLAKRNDSRSNA